MMRDLTKEDLKKYANKLMFDMEDNEYETLLGEFGIVLKHFEKMNELDGIENIDPLVFPFVNSDATLREDVATDSLSAEEAFLNAKDVLNNEIKVPKVVE